MNFSFQSFDLGFALSIAVGLILPDLLRRLVAWAGKALGGK